MIGGAKRTLARLPTAAQALLVALGAAALLWGVHGWFDPSRLHVWGRFIDQAGYVTTARHLADTGELRSGLVYPAFLDDPRWRPYLPGHYVVLAASYVALGYSAFASVLPNLIGFVVVATCLFLVGRRLYTAGTGLLATLLFAVFPSFLLYAFTAMAELTFTAVGLLAFTVFVYLPERARAWAVPLLVALPFLFRETGALWVLPMAALLATTGAPGRARRTALACAASVALVYGLNAWQLADGKGDAPLSWVLQGSFNYTDAVAEPPPELSPLGWVVAVVRNVGRNASTFWTLASTDPSDVRVPGALLIALLVAANAALAWRRRGKEPLALGVALLGLALYGLILGLYDVKSEKLLRSSLFAFPLALLPVVAALERRLAGRARPAAVAGLALAAVAGLLVARDLGRGLVREDAAIDLLTRRIDALGPPPDQLLVGHFPTTLNYAVEHYPVRWAFLPSNEETLELLNERYSVGMVILPDRALEKRFSPELFERLGLKLKPRVIQSLDHGPAYYVYVRPNG